MKFKNNNKKVFLKKMVFIVAVCFVSCFFFVNVLPVKAQTGGLDATAEAAGLNTQNNDLIGLIARVVELVLGFLGIVFLILVMYGGFMRMTAKGEAEQISKSMKIITSAAVGVFIVLAAYIITSFVFNSVEKSMEGASSVNNYLEDSSNIRTNSGGLEYVDRQEEGGEMETDENGEQYYRWDNGKEYVPE